MSDADSVWYSFIVKGAYPGDIKATLRGYCKGPPKYPSSVFDRAVEVAVSMAEGLVVDRSKSGNVSLMQLKKAPKHA